MLGIAYVRFALTQTCHVNYLVLASTFIILILLSIKLRTFLDSIWLMYIRSLAIAFYIQQQMNNSFMIFSENDMTWRLVEFGYMGCVVICLDKLVYLECYRKCHFRWVLQDSCSNSCSSCCRRYWHTLLKCVCTIPISLSYNK